MEKVARVLLVAGLALTGVVFAIPNSVGGFINPAGMRFEEFAVKPDTWKQDAKLPGEWEMWSDDSAATDSDQGSPEVLKLSLTAVVFGIDADEVTVYRANEKVQKFRIDFADGEKTTSALKTNIGLWADGEWDSANNSVKHGPALISLGEENVVTISAAE